jgi:8-oxo-dGTP diphosphatase
MAIDPEAPIRVGIGLIGRAGSYLIRERPAGSPMAGFWEFPGGKCEPGESPKAATARESREEVGVEVEVGDLFHRVVHRYPHGLVELHYFRCATDGEPVPGSGFVWITAGDLPSYKFPEANEVVVVALGREAARSARLSRDVP